MFNQRWRPVVCCLGGVVVIWAVAMTGYYLSKNSRMTAERVAAYAASVNLAKLSAADRAKALRALADQINLLSVEERRKARFDETIWAWMAEMTEAEKEQFIETTMPTGFKQMLTAFEEMPEDKRRRVIGDALGRLREAQSRIQAEEGYAGGTNFSPFISEELQARIRKIGLKTFYSQSSAQTKAELAPVLEELQRVMESGRAFHGH
jgi:hypothetical protein